MSSGGVVVRYVSWSVYKGHLSVFPGSLYVMVWSQTHKTYTFLKGLDEIYIIIHPGLLHLPIPSLHHPLLNRLNLPPVTAIETSSCVRGAMLDMNFEKARVDPYSYQHALSDGLSNHSP